MSGPTCSKPVAVADEQEMLSVVIQRDHQVSSSDVKWLGFIMKDEGGESSISLLPKHKIPKVPKVLRQVESNQKCYDPEVVSIGPYHHGKKELESYEKLKIPFTREYVKSCNTASTVSCCTQIQIQLYDKVAKVAGEAKKFYAVDPTEDIDDTAFKRMMFLDGCFIIQFISCIVNKKEAKLKMKNHDIAFIQRDLFLLENQLPFKVLQALMSLNSKIAGDDKGLKWINEFIRSIRASPPEDSFLEKVENFITQHITARKSQPPPQSQSQDEPVHLLDLMRRQLIDPNAFDDKGDSNSSNWYSYRSVQELKTAGIHFRPDKKSNLFTHARYENLITSAILRLPTMTIDDSTRAVLLNLVAYEMCPDSPNDYGVTSYLWFMDTLIDHSEDVKELRKKGILLNYLSSDEEVATIFNEIAKNLVPNTPAYKNVKDQIEKHYKNKVKLWMTEWLHTHFRTPWAFLAFLAAVLAIALSFVQTYYAVNPK